MFSRSYQENVVSLFVVVTSTCTRSASPRPCDSAITVFVEEKSSCDRTRAGPLASNPNPNGVSRSSFRCVDFSFLFGRRSVFGPHHQSQSAPSARNIRVRNTDGERCWDRTRLGLVVFRRKHHRHRRRHRLSGAHVPPLAILSHSSRRFHSSSARCRRHQL